MKELIVKLKKQIAALQARQEEALVASQASGVSDDDYEKHAAEFDAALAEKARAQADLKRAEQLDAEQTATALAEVAPATQPVVQGPHNPLAGAHVRVAATPRRVRTLRAFSGPNAEAEAYQSGLWLLGAVLGHGPARQQYQERYGPMAATLGIASNGGAAYLVPNVMDATIVKLTEEYGVARRLCRLQGMTSDTWEGPRWTGVLTAYFVAEGASPIASEQSYDKVSLVAKNLAAKGKITRQLDEDAIVDIGDEWAEAAAIAFAEKEDQCLFNGDGTSTYGGITGLFAKITAAANAASLVTATGHTTLSSLTVADYSAAVGRVPNYPGIKPVWLCHKEIWANSMQPLQLAAGGATVESIAAGGKPMFLGYPVEIVNVAPRAASVTTGVTGILLGDLRLAAMFGDRRKRTFETGLENDDFSKQLFTLLMTERFDINVHTVVDPKNSSSPGPVIGLKLG